MGEQSQTQVNIAPAPKPSFSAAQDGLLQRKCACNGSQGLAGDCKECGKKPLILQRYSANRAKPSDLLRSLPEASELGSRATVASGLGHDFSRVQVHTRAPQSIQAKLAVSQPGDQSEQEADRIAEQVTGIHAPSGPEANQPSTALSQTQPLNQERDDDEAADSSGAAPAPSSAETAAPEETAATGLILEDEAQESVSGQMRKSEFLDALRDGVCATADAELAAVGRDTEGCPYIERWISYYRTQSSPHIERAIHRYAPETAGVTSARDYIPVIAERVRSAVAVWATTGQITGVPEGVSAEAPGAGAPAGGGSAPSAAGKILLKGREGGARDADPRAIQAQLSSGHSLDGSARSRMESAFGHDFSRVRVHTDARAAGLAANLDARAFTVGSDIAFGAGEYQPGTLVGDALLAHELAHVVQQVGSVSSTAPMSKGGAEYNGLEEDADYSAVGAVVSLWGGAKGALANIAQNALPRLKSGLRLQRCPSKEKEEKPAPTPTPAPAPDAGAPPGCDASFAGVTFSLADQTASGAKPAVSFLIGQQGGKFALVARGIAPAKYKPKITISAPSDAKAKEFEVGIIQNLLTDKREITFTAGGPILTKMPVPMKDGAPKGSGAEDDVFAENGSGHPGILVGFTTKSASATLKLPDTPGDFGFINLKDNSECAGSKVPGTMTGMALKDSFRTWTGVRHKPSKCIKTIHHIDWDIDWSATVNGTASPPTHSVTSEALNVTQPNGDGSPTFVSGGKVPAELIATVRKCGP